MQNITADKLFPFLLSPCMLATDMNTFMLWLNLGFVPVLKGEGNCHLRYQLSQRSQNERFFDSGRRVKNTCLLMETWNQEGSASEEICSSRAQVYSSVSDDAIY